MRSLCLKHLCRGSSEVCLTHGLLTKKATSKQTNQSGQIKVNNAHNILERNDVTGSLAGVCWPCEANVNGNSTPHGE